MSFPVRSRSQRLTFLESWNEGRSRNHRADLEPRFVHWNRTRDLRCLSQILSIRPPLQAEPSAGWAQLWNDEPSLGQGAKGYAQRYGVATTDQFSSGFFSRFLYPSIFKEDPRYYRRGEGPFKHRLFHAVSHIIVAHRNSGAAQFNFSEWFGLTSSVALRNLYHPDRLRRFEPAAR